MFALVDCNNFFASCERVFRPDLNKKPLVVLSNNDGCVIARSNEAKDLGIPMGAPAYKYKSLFQLNNVNVFSCNFPLYGDMSSRVMNILSSYAPEMEIYSIDEAFLDFRGCNINLQETGENIHKQVLKWTGIPVSVGFAHTKALAKVANRIAKKYPQRTNGVYIIDSEEKRIKALKWLKIEDVWGIGRKYSKRLLSLGVKTAYDFIDFDLGWIKKNMGVVGERLQKELKGVSVLKLEDIQPKKNIATTRTFETNYKEYDKIRERVASFTVISAEKLRRQKSLCQNILVFISSNWHRKDIEQYYQSIIIKLPYATDSTIDLVKYAIGGLEKIFKDGYEYKKAGVILQDIIPENTCQLNIFSQPNPKHKILMEAIDKINSNFGQQKIRLGSQSSGNVWKMKQENLSKHYTTDIDEIINVIV